MDLSEIWLSWIPSIGRLAKICQNDLNDTDEAIVAWKLLLGSPAQERAFVALEKIYESTKAYGPLAELFAERAKLASSAAAADGAGRVFTRLTCA